MKATIESKLLFHFICCTSLCAFLCSGLTTSLANAQKSSEMKQRFGQSFIAAQKGLPQQWHGVWKGETNLSWTNGKTEKVLMELETAPLKDRNADLWKIIYAFSDRREERNYEIKLVEGSSNHFVIDEKNGFLIDNFLSSDTLFSQFTINGNLVTTRFELIKNEITVELTMFDIRTPRKTKLTGGNFEVSSYHLKYIQKGVLKREQQEKTRVK